MVTQRLVSTVVVCLLGAAVLTGVAVGVGGLSDAGNASFENENTSIATEDTNIVTENASIATENVSIETENASIATELQSADGTVEAFVLFNDTAVSNPLSDADNGVEMAKANAEAAQSPLKSFAAEQPGVTVERGFWIANAALVTVDTDRLPIEALATVEGVTHITEHPEFETLGGTVGEDSATPTEQVQTPAPPDSVTETEYETTYGLAQIGATEVWDSYDTRGEGATVAVLDTGVDPAHPDIDIDADNWIDFHSNGTVRETDPLDYDTAVSGFGGHGTHVSGTVLGGNASGEHIGVAPDAELYAVPVLPNCDPNCTGTGAQVFGGMEWAVEQGVDSISMSLGGTGYNPVYIQAIRNAHEAGTVVVASAGNDGEGTSGSPANVYESIAAGAANEATDIAAFSAGERIERLDWTHWFAPDDWPEEYVVPTVAAPGVSVNSAIPVENAATNYTTKSGTSMAAPHVSGAIALIQSATAEHISPADLTTALESTAWKPDEWDEPTGERDVRYGSGIIDVPAALDLLKAGPRASISPVSDPVVTDSMTLNASETTGTNISTYRWDLTGDGEIDTETDEPTVSHAFSETGVTRVTLSVTDDANRTHWTVLPVTVTGPPPVVGDDAPTDRTGDGLYDDITGDGTLTIADVQALFDHKENASAYPQLFDFSGLGGDSVTIFDVQALFNRFVGATG